MKKFICGLLIGLLLSLPLATFASGQALKLIINGQDITADAQPVIIGGRTLVPARALAEKLGATVSWDAANQTVVVTSNKIAETVEKESVELTDEWGEFREVFRTHNLSFSPIMETRNGLDYVIALDVSVADIWTENPPIFRVSIADGTLITDLGKGGIYVKRTYVEEQLKKAGLL